MKKNLNGTNDPKKFRISAKRLFLTYSQVPEELTSENILLQLQQKLQFQHYIIAPERHEDGGLHYHVVVTKQRKFNIKQADKLDVDFQQQKFHGNYQPVKNFEAIVEYVCKDNTYSTSFKNIQDGKLLSMEEDLMHTLSHEGVEHTVQRFIQEYPKQAFRGINAINANRLLHSVKPYMASATTLHTESKSKSQEEDNLPVSIEDFDLPDKLRDWMNLVQPTLFLVGEGGTGKTLFCRALAKHLKLKTLEINHIDAIRQLTDEHQMLIFDDLCFTGIDSQQLLALVDSQQDRVIRVLHGTVKKHKDLVQVFTLNLNVLKQIRSKLRHTQFLRRITIVKLEKSLVVNIQLNIPLHNHTNLFNNIDNIKQNQLLLESL